jgi:hypothetical protein
MLTIRYPFLEENGENERLVADKDRVSTSCS